MSGIWGRKIKLSIFGESHGSAIGITIDGLPSGFKLDIEDIKCQMARRAPGKSKLSTQREEDDEFEILSGVFNGKTEGTPLCAVIKNMNMHSIDYTKTNNLVRPGHADYTGSIKYSGFNDSRGGGHFSGRITAPLLFAGAIATQMLYKDNIIVGSHIKSIERVQDKPIDFVNINKATLEKLKGMDFPVFDDACSENMKSCIIKAKDDGDSVGGIVETAIINLPPGIGDPFFDSVESCLSHMLFSIPAVKGVEFGSGFGIASMKGSCANDKFYMDRDNIKTYTNNNGGILGGITNGMPVIFRVAIKPTPSISKKQKTIDIKEKKDDIIEIKGRHDPCIVQRAVPVIEGAVAITILDLML